MPVVNCPHCAQPLQLTDEMLGRSMQCPVCTRVFQFGAAPQAPPVVISPVAPTTAGAFEFGESEQTGTSRVRVGSATSWVVMGAVTTMMFILSYFGMVAWLLSIIPLRFLLDIFMVRLLLLGFTVILPLVFVFVGSRALAGQWSYGLVLAGAILGFVLTLGLLTQCILLLFDALSEPKESPPLVQMVVCFEFILAGLAAVAAALNMVGGVKTLLILQHPDVVRAFEVRARRQYRDD
jgi:hypothetical protein